MEPYIDHYKAYVLYIAHYKRQIIKNVLNNGLPGLQIFNTLCIWNRILNIMNPMYIVHYKPNRKLSTPCLLSLSTCMLQHINTRLKITRLYSPHIFILHILHKIPTIGEQYQLHQQSETFLCSM